MSPKLGFNPKFPLEKAVPAPYNPRMVSDKELSQLAESIRKFGFAKPIVCSANGEILAGHQRTKTAKALGLTHVPAFVTKEWDWTNSVSSNQLENATDAFIDTDVSLPSSPSTRTWVEVDPLLIDAEPRQPGAQLRSDMMNLMGSIGNYGSCVADISGRVVAGGQYALCCKTLRLPCRTFYIPSELSSEARKFFGQKYGKFCYDNIPRDTYIQSKAQLTRITSTGHTRSSSLYARAIPYLDKQDRILDFGAGRCEMAKQYNKQGYKIWPVEFFHHEGSVLNRRAVHKMIDRALCEYKTNGPFDAVILDSVLNSIDSSQAERDVLITCNAFLRDGGLFFGSGLCASYDSRAYKANKCVTKKPSRMNCLYLDDQGFSATSRNGHWFFQRFHTFDEIKAIAPTYFGSKPEYVDGDKESASNFHVVCRKHKTFDSPTVASSVAREFNLAWPTGSVDRHEQALSALMLDN